MTVSAAEDDARDLTDHVGCERSSLAESLGVVAVVDVVWLRVGWKTVVVVRLRRRDWRSASRQLAQTDIGGSVILEDSLVGFFGSDRELLMDYLLFLLDVKNGSIRGWESEESRIELSPHDSGA